MATALSDLLEQWQGTAEKARLSNLERAEQIKAIHGEIIRRYEPGGPFEARGLAGLEKQKRREVGAEMQQMISSGLYGTTTAAGGGRRWEEAVGEPGRMRLEDIMMQRLSQAQLGMAGFMERIEEPYPDYALMAGLTQQAAAGPSRAPRQAAPAVTRADYGPGPSDPEFLGGGWGLASSLRTPTPTTTTQVGPRTKVTTPTAPTTAPTGAPTPGYWGASERWRAEQGLGREIPAQTTPAGMEEYLKTYTARTGDYSVVGQRAAQPTPQEVGMTGGMGGLPGQIGTTGWTEAEKKAWANYVPGVSGYNVPAAKARQKKKASGGGATGSW